jgi:hypothetical protein
MDQKVRYEISFNQLIPQLYMYISTPSGLSEWFADNVILEVNFILLFGMIQRKQGFG